MKTPLNSILLSLPAIIVMLFLSSNSFATTFDLAWETPTIFKTPESVVFDERTELLFVSNIDGAPNEQDGNGFISTVSSTGAVIELQWVEGLNAPKGLAIVGSKLYVSDINELVEIDIDHGKIVQRYHAEGAQFLNDVASDNSGNIYVSDMMTNVIYRLNAGVFEVWLSSEKLENPNGLLIQGDQMIVASWGKMTDGFNTEIPGHLKQVSINDKTISSLGDASPAGNLDGLTTDGQQGYFVTDWMKGGLLQIDSFGNTTKVITLAQGSADHTYLAKSKLVLIPMMMEGKLFAYTAAH